jgi:lysophospholipase L1-like esterase
MLKRFDRDVLAQPGASHLVVLAGVNDLRNRRGDPAEDVSAPQLIMALTQIARRARTGGLATFACTILPYEKESWYALGWSPAREEVRSAVNTWLRKQKEFDALIDFDRAMRDPARPTMLLPQFDCGDHIHPSDDGYIKMGDLVFEALQK